MIMSIDTSQYLHEHYANKPWQQLNNWVISGTTNGRPIDDYRIIFAGTFSASNRLLTLAHEQQEACRRAIDDLLNTAGKQNWDGEGADPVTENTVAIAKGIVGELPRDVGVPEISSAPEGSVEFDWYLNNGTMFTISIGKTGDVAVSGLYKDEAKLTGMQWDRKGDIKSLLQCGLRWLMSMHKNDNGK